MLHRVQIARTTSEEVYVAGIFAQSQKRKGLGYNFSSEVVSRPAAAVRTQVPMSHQSAPLRGLSVSLFASSISAQ